MSTLGGKNKEQDLSLIYLFHKQLFMMILNNKSNQKCLQRSHYPVWKILNARSLRLIQKKLREITHCIKVNYNQTKGLRVYRRANGIGRQRTENPRFNLCRNLKPQAKTFFRENRRCQSHYISKMGYKCEILKALLIINKKIYRKKVQVAQYIYQPQILIYLHF